MVKRKRKPTLEPQYERPTPEREAKGEFVSAGMARRQTPVIDTLRDAWNTDAEAGRPLDKRRGIAPAEHDALAYYREQAHKAQDDMAKASPLAPETIMGGRGQFSGGGIPCGLIATPAIIETRRIERDLGQVADIVRAVAVEDHTLSQWCIDKYGGRERFCDGKVVSIEPVEKRAVEFALLELRMASYRISR